MKVKLAADVEVAVFDKTGTLTGNVVSPWCDCPCCMYRLLKGAQNCGCDKTGMSWLLVLMQDLLIYQTLALDVVSNVGSARL